MNVLFYITKPNTARKGISLIMETAASKADTEILANIRDLSLRLARPESEITIIVLFISNETDLNKLVRIRHLLTDRPLILILPSRDNNTTSCGYSLAPRFLTYMDEDSREVAAVLEKMLLNHKKRIVRT